MKIELTPSEINVAIAELVGQWRFKPQANYVVILEGDETKMRYFPSEPDNIALCLSLAGVPDYHGDLNAIAQAEATLTGGFKSGDEWLQYVKLLHAATNGRGECATAAQRARAFLAVKGVTRAEGNRANY